MEKHFYTCQYCGKEYVPTRRKVQRFCSNSCRTRAFVIKKGVGLSVVDNTSIPKVPESKIVNSKTEKMSWAGIGNAAVGTIAVNALANLLTNDENKPATKKDIHEMKNLLTSRYLPIQNSSPDSMGNYPFYDTVTKNIVYLKTVNHGK